MGFPKRGARLNYLNASHFEHVGNIEKSRALLLRDDDLLAVGLGRSRFNFLDLPAPQKPYCDVSKHGARSSEQLSRGELTEDEACEEDNASEDLGVEISINTDGLQRQANRLGYSCRRDKEEPVDGQD